jgi:hypothetical protein
MLALDGCEWTTVMWTTVMWTPVITEAASEYVDRKRKRNSSASRAAVVCSANEGSAFIKGGYFNP